MSVNDLDMLRSQWTELYSKILPSLAKKRDSAQPKWPVTLDHCFARIILDNTIGNGISQWDHIIPKPAVKNMDGDQFKAAIALGEDIRQGKADLVALDQISLMARGKGQHKYKHATDTTLAHSATTDKKRAATVDEDGDHQQVELATKPTKRSKTKQSTLPFTLSPLKQKDAEESSSTTTTTTKSQGPDPTPASKPSSSTRPDPKFNFQGLSQDALLDKIAQHNGLTPFRRRLYSTLLSVPSGRHTTYAAMASVLNSSARAVGNGMRNNPFAPDVPCHRVLAVDGSIGGFHGDWGKEGKYAGHKVELLASEGVKFDSVGKVKGAVFTDLKDLSRGR